MQVSRTVTINMIRLSYLVGRLVQVLSTMDIYNQKLADDIEWSFSHLDGLYDGNNIRDYLRKLGLKVFIVADRFYPEPLKVLAKDILDYIDFISNTLYGERVTDFIKDYIKTRTG